MACPFFWVKAYMISLLASCVVIYWPSNRQCARCVLDAFNPCPHSHVKRLNVKGWIEPRWKCNVKMKVKCAMRNKQINGLTINHSPTPLPKQKQMWALNVEQIKSCSKIDLKDVSWRMSIKDACKIGALVIVKLSKEECIFLNMGRMLFWIAWKHDWKRCGPLSTWKTYSSKMNLLK
jgi:hypothetical protein